MYRSNRRRRRRRPLLLVAFVFFAQYSSHLPVIVRQVVVRPTEYICGCRRRIGTGRRRVGRGRRRVGRGPTSTVAGAQGPFGYQLGGHGLQVVRPSDQREQVDEQRGQVQLVVEQLGVLVVPRERVMVVVPSVATRGHRHQYVLGRVDVPARNNTITIITVTTAAYANASSAGVGGQRGWGSRG